MSRIHLVVRRIVQCLYLHHTGIKLPTETHESRVLSIESLAAMDPDAPRRLREDFLDQMAKEPNHIYANNQFSYRVIQTEKPFVSVWALVFYGKLPFVAFTGPKVNVAEEKDSPAPTTTDDHAQP